MKHIELIIYILIVIACLLAGFLGHIALSLAVIADKMTEKDEVNS